MYGGPEMRLVFQSLELTNYRYYYGTQRIEFPEDAKQNVLVIKGDNGAGKSNILNALTWCLYGEEIHTDKKSKGLPVMNTGYIEELAKTNREGEVSVTLTLDVDDILWEIMRKVRGSGVTTPNPDDLPSYEFRQAFSGLKVTYFDEDGNQKIEAGDMAQKLINDLLPAALRSFFFIDGEQLREFFKVDASQKMQKSIERLSQLDLLESVYDSLLICRKDLREKVQESNPATAEIQKELQEKEGVLETCRKKINELKENEGRIRAELEVVNQYLMDNLIGNVPILAREIESLEKRNDSDKKKRNDLIKIKETFLVESAPVILLADVIDNASEMIESLMEKGDLPPKIKQSFIQELLETGVCICGTKLTDVERMILTEYADKIQLSELTGIAFEGKSEFGSLRERIDNFPNDLEKMTSEIDELNEGIRRTESEIERKKEEIAEYNVDEINNYVGRRDRLNQEIGGNNKTFNMFVNRFKMHKSDLEKLNRQAEIENQKYSVHDKYTKQIELVQETIQVLERIKERVKETIRKSIEENTKKYFMEFLREEGTFRDVTIDEKYQVSVINNQGFNALASLSAGQYLILGYAFVVALRTITGYNAPVIVDTPLGKLDITHRNKVTKLLPKLLGDAQLMFLVTSSEYTSDVRENFAPYMMKNAYYEIERDNEKTSARLTQHAV